MISVAIYKECEKKQRKIDALERKAALFEARVMYLENKLEKLKKGSFGSSTPSSQIPFKENTK
jgi:predicted RNase H-like nuclease (RuvC/YqgF family)